VPDLPWEGQLIGERTCPGMPDDTLPCAKIANRSISHLGYGLGWPKEAQVHIYSLGCANVP